MKSLPSVLLVPVLSLAWASGSCGQVENDPQDFWNIGLSGGGVITNIAVSPIDPEILMLATNMGGVFLTYEGPK